MYTCHLFKAAGAPTNIIFLWSKERHSVFVVFSFVNFFLSFFLCISLRMVRNVHLLVFREWTEETLRVGINAIMDDLPIAPGAPGGMSEYRRTLALRYYDWVASTHMPSNEWLPMKASHIWAFSLSWKAWMHCREHVSMPLLLRYASPMGNLISSSTTWSLLVLNMLFFSLSTWALFFLQQAFMQKVPPYIRQCRTHIKATLWLRHSWRFYDHT